MPRSIYKEKMNIHQHHLLDLLKEVDAFCKEHQITYYCAGGTVIGAARHHGFIPWDDDIDIYMTRNEFRRFAEALEKDGPADRKLEYYEADNDRRAPVPRFHRDTDTLFCHFHLLGRSCAGTSLDVFILDPIPDDHGARVDYIAKLYAYCDLIAPCHVYSHRLPVSKFDVYDKYKKLADEKGFPYAIQQISDEIFCFDEKDCRDYCLRWGSVPLIYPVKVIGKPAYLPFEDMMIPVPQDWYRYLVIHYGMDWADLPYEEVQHEHVNILNYDVRYDHYYEKRDELFSQEELLDIHFRWKDAERRFYRTAEPIDKHVKETRDRICRAEIDKRLAEYDGASPGGLFASQRYEEIADVYAPYLELQLSHAYMGRRMRHGTQFRYLFPFVMPLGEAELDILMTSLLKTGRQSTVEKICGIYRRANIGSYAIDRAEESVKLINDVRRAYYLGEYEEALRLIEGSGIEDEIPAITDFYWLAKVRSNITEEDKAELRDMASAEGCSTAIRKAWADLLWSQGKCYDAEPLYKDLMKNSRNGLFWLDISDKIPDLEPIPTKRLTPFKETDIIEKQRVLLEEIAEICKENGIKYVVGADLARRMYLTGNIGFVNSNRELLMDADAAAKFVKAFSAADLQDRRLLSWKNSSRIKDMALIYTDTDSIYCDFRDLAKWRDLGACITIRVLGEPSGMLGLKCRMLGRDASAIKASDLYYYTNLKGKRPVRHKVSRALLEDICETEVNGISYIIPKSVTSEDVKQETDLSNVPPIESVFIYKSTGMTWDEISPLIDDAAYNALDWDGYFESRKTYRKIDEKVRKIWQTMLDLDKDHEAEA